MRVYSFEGIVGIEPLWEICILSTNQKAMEESMELLVNLHLKFDNGITIEEQKEVWKKFIDHCMNILAQEAANINNNQLKITALLKLIILFLDKYEGKKAIKPESRMAQ